jgi:hypothetical protein
MWAAGSTDKSLDTLQLMVGYAVLVLIFGFGLVILVKMASGTIDISALLSEVGGGASMSRFQLLVFTFVIALSLFLLVAEKREGLPDIPSGILTLLGISATTYGVSKGIQLSSGAPSKDPNQGGAAAGARAGAATGAAAGAAAGAVTGAAAAERENE